MECWLTKLNESSQRVIVE